MNDSPSLDPAAVEIPAESSEQKIETPSPQVEQTPQRRPHFAGFRKWILLGAVCVELGLLVGLVAKPSPKTADKPERAEDRRPTIPELSLRFAMPDSASSIDTLIRSGNYPAALARCQASSTTDAATELRTAICLEALGKHKPAIEVYRQLIARDDAAIEAAAGWSGIARCAIQLGLKDEANSALDHIVTHANQPVFTKTGGLGKALCLQAWLQTRSSQHEEEHFSTNHPVVVDSPLLALIGSDLERWLVAAHDTDTPHVPRSEVSTGEVTEPTTAYDRKRAVWMRALAGESHMTWAGALCVELGNLEMQEGRPLAAVTWYERALGGLPARARFAAAYNLGAARFRAYQFTPARNAFLVAIDSSTQPKQAAWTWWWVGRCWLDTGDAKKAQTAFRKAVDLTPDADFRALASVALSTACLVNGDDKAAHRALSRHHADVRASEYRNFAAILDLAACSNKKTKVTDDADRIDALLQVVDASPVGPAGVDLLGRELERFGFHDRAMKMYEANLPECRGCVVGSPGAANRRAAVRHRTTRFSADALRINHRRRPQGCWRSRCSPHRGDRTQARPRGRLPDSVPHRTRRPRGISCRSVQAHGQSVRAIRRRRPRRSMLRRRRSRRGASRIEATRRRT